MSAIGKLPFVAGPSGLVVLRTVVSSDNALTGTVRNSSEKPAASQTSVLRIISIKAADAME